MLVLAGLSSATAWAIKAGGLPPGEVRPYLDSHLYIESTLMPWSQAKDFLPNPKAWEAFRARHPGAWVIHIDPRTGRPAGMVGRIPWIPGTGKGNRVTLQDLARELGHEVVRVDETIVRELTRRFIRENREVLGVDPGEIGTIRATRVNEYLWHIAVTRAAGGVPVRDSWLTLTVNHGNIVLIGVDRWGDVPPMPGELIPKEKALAVAFERAGGRKPTDVMVVEPHLEWIPMAAEPTGDPARDFGRGYDYHPAWVFRFRRETYGPTWEALVDAAAGRLLALQDVNRYGKKHIVGGVYPVSNDGTPPDGVEQSGYPMPWADTGFSSPNDYTNSAGLYDYTGGTVTTHLNGLYIHINDNCGTINESDATGDLDLGVSGGTDCVVPSGHSSGDTHSARSGFYELNRMKEEARGWLPSNSWLQAQLTANMNITATCNAYWNGTTVNFFKSGGGCANTGEIAAVFDHEWGHGMDDNDSNGSISSPGEAIADMYAALRLQTSCIGRGFLLSGNCGGYGDPCLNCSGVRDVDWDQHESHTPHTPQNFIQPNCTGGSGPCGREVHCEGYVAAETGWDFAARDLQSAPYNYDSNMAFMLAERTAFLGSGLVTEWYTCSGGGANSDGCGANNGYMQWVAADDDNGDINDGTPHMTGIYNAYNRHNIACDTPTPTDSGCSGGPGALTNLTAIPGNNQVDLSWPAVTGATHYWVFRGEGVNGCAFGKAKIADVTGTSYSDTEVANGRTYYYMVVPVGANSACVGLASPCVSVAPAPGPQASFFGFSTMNDSCPYGGPGDGNGLVEPGESVTIGVILENDGIVDLTNIAGTLVSSNPWVTINDNAGTWPDIPIGSTAPQNDTFQYDVDPAAACSSSLDFEIDLTYDQGGNITTFSQTVGGNRPNDPHFVCNPCAQDINVTPTTLDFGPVNVGTTKDLDITVQNLGVADLTVGTVTAPSPPFSVVSDGCTGQTVAPGASCVVTVRFAPTAEGTFTDTMVINSDDPDEPAVQVDLSGQGVNPDIYVDPPAVDFGIVGVGAGPVRAVTISNIGAGTLDISPITPPSVPFSFDADGCSGQTLPPSGQCQILVKFQSAVPGSFTDAFTINTNDPDEPAVTINLSGTAEEPVISPVAMNLNETGGNGNGVWEINETAVFETAWKNTGNVPTGYLSGTAVTNDPVGNLDDTAAYGYVTPGVTHSCTVTGDCYAATALGPRPSAHWDVVLTETISTGYSFDWRIHVGESFDDVPQSHPFYSFIETLLHSGVTAGCTATAYCPVGTVTRAQMGIFIARAMAGGDANIPGAGTVGSCNYNCTAGGTSCFSDVAPDAAYCRHVHYLAAQGVTSGCRTAEYCPRSPITRGQMAVFLVRAFQLLLYGP